MSIALAPRGRTFLLGCSLRPSSLDEGFFWVFPQALWFSILLLFTVYYNYLNTCLSPLLVNHLRRSWTVSLVHCSTARAHHVVGPLCIFSEWVNKLPIRSLNFLGFMMLFITTSSMCTTWFVWFSPGFPCFPFFFYEFLCWILYILSMHWPPPTCKVFILFSVCLLLSMTVL